MNDAYILYDQLIKTNLLLADGDRQFFSQYGLTPVRFYALKHIQEKPGLSLSDLSALLLCTKGNATRILKSMETDGFLFRAADPNDQRAYRLEITAQGVELFEKVKLAYQDYNQTRFQRYSEGELLEMIEEIKKMNADLVQLLNG